MNFYDSLKASFDSQEAAEAYIRGLYAAGDFCGNNLTNFIIRKDGSMYKVEPEED